VRWKCAGRCSPSCAVLTKTSKKKKEARQTGKAFTGNGGRRGSRREERNWRGGDYLVGWWRDRMDAQHPNGTRHHELDVEGVVDPTRVDRSVLSTLWDGK
jgi:hypothetical protein